MDIFFFFFFQSLTLQHRSVTTPSLTIQWPNNKHYLMCLYDCRQFHMIGSYLCIKRHSSSTSAVFQSLIHFPPHMKFCSDLVTLELMSLDPMKSEWGVHRGGARLAVDWFSHQVLRLSSYKIETERWPTPFHTSQPLNEKFWANRPFQNKTNDLTVNPELHI